MTSSSSLENCSAPSVRPNSTGCGGAWCSQVNDTQPWIQINLTSVYHITGLRIRIWHRKIHVCPPKVQETTTPYPTSSTGDGMDTTPSGSTESLLASSTNSSDTNITTETTHFDTTTRGTTTITDAMTTSLSGTTSVDIECTTTVTKDYTDIKYRIQYGTDEGDLTLWDQV